jgi:hypothetical protein
MDHVFDTIAPAEIKAFRNVESGPSQMLFIVKPCVTITSGNCSTPNVPLRIRPSDPVEFSETLNVGPGMSVAVNALAFPVVFSHVEDSFAMKISPLPIIHGASSGSSTPQLPKSLKKILFAYLARAVSTWIRSRKYWVLIPCHFQMPNAVVEYLLPMQGLFSHRDPAQ